MTDLESWSNGAARDAIVTFVEAISSGPDAVPVEERIAVFDNDGTLWTEKPMPSQLHYIVGEWARAAAADSSLAERQPYKAAVTGDLSWLGAVIDKHYAGDDSDLPAVVSAIVEATGQANVEDYAASVPPSAVCRSGLPSDGGVASVSRGARLHELHRLGRRSRLHEADEPRHLWHPAGAGDRIVARAHLRRGDRSRALRHGGRVPRRRTREARADLEPHRAPADPRGGQLERRRPDAAVRAGASAEPQPAHPPR